MEELTFQARPDRRLTGTRLLLDQEGWTRVADAVAQEFAEQYEEQEDARRRTDRTGERLFRIGSLLLAFELPIKDGFQVGPALVPGEELMIPFPVRVSKVFDGGGTAPLIVNTGNFEKTSGSGKTNVSIKFENKGSDLPPL
jgi:hypothetical protein